MKFLHRLSIMECPLCHKKLTMKQYTNWDIIQFTCLGHCYLEINSQNIIDNYIITVSDYKFYTLDFHGNKLSVLKKISAELNLLEFPMMFFNSLDEMVVFVNKCINLKAFV